MTAQRRRGAACRSIVAGGAALAALALASCFAEVPAARPGWTPREIDAQRLCAAGEAPACGELGRLLITHVASEKDVNRGVVLLETSCASGDAASCLTLGGSYRDRGDDKALARATDLMTRACDLKSAEGCLELAVLREAWDRHDLAPVLEGYGRACELGSAKACALLGSALRRQTPRDPRAGDDAFIRACGLGDLASCHGLGKSRIDNPATRAEGVAYLFKACGGGFVASCITAAELLAPVVGEAASWAQALPVAERACAYKNGASCAIADACRIEGHRDVVAATQRLRAACDGGLSLACFYWANAVGPTTDAESVIRAYGESCDGDTSLGRRLACTRVAVLTLARATTDVGVHALTSRLEDACEDSVGEACCALADVYDANLWSPADALMASELRTKGCNLGALKCCPR